MEKWEYLSDVFEEGETGLLNVLEGKGREGKGREGKGWELVVVRPVGDGKMRGIFKRPFWEQPADS